MKLTRLLPILSTLMLSFDLTAVEAHADPVVTCIDSIANRLTLNVGAEITGTLRLVMPLGEIHPGKYKVDLGPNPNGQPTPVFDIKSDDNPDSVLLPLARVQFDGAQIPSGTKVTRSLIYPLRADGELQLDCTAKP